MAEIDQHNVTGDKGRKKITLLDDEYDDESDEIRVDDGEEPRADSTTTTSSYRSPGGRRDEVIEVRKMSSKDTNRLRLWRIIVTGVLLLTAFAITYTTFVLLKNQEDDNFRTAFEQFARTVGDAAVDQQQRMRDSLAGFAGHVSSYAHSANATWPMVRLPDFELHAGSRRLAAGAEIFTFNSFIEEKDQEEYLKFIDANYLDAVNEGHLIRYGNTSRLAPIGYTPNFTLIGPTGFLPDLEQRQLRGPSWQLSPPITTFLSINWDVYSQIPDYKKSISAMFELKNETIYSAIRPYEENDALDEKEHSAMHSTLANSDISYPHSFVNNPIHEIPNDYESKIVGTVGASFAWDAALRFLLPDNVEGIIVEIQNSCNQSVLYELVGYDALYLGDNATKDSTYDEMVVVRDLFPTTHPNYTKTPVNCRYKIRIFPSSKFHDSYETNTPTIYAALVAFTFVIVALVFFIYDMLVQNRNEKIVATAARSNAIVTSIFPDAIRDRLLQQTVATTKRGQLRSYLSDGGIEGAGDQSAKPLADLFLETTIMFADISGFTAWSSVRDPSQVFTLLETLYRAFDEIANCRRVFKVETVGDCYVAVTGLPDPQKDHAVLMARYARDILSKMSKVCRELELTLGPGTADLNLRIGIHSGPVTGGVLRGERSRFQLFGDTMNTAARIESTGKIGCIHLSSETANLLTQAGKSMWLKKRDECVVARGKGSIQTYWLTVARKNSNDTDSCGDNDDTGTLSGHSDPLDMNEFVVKTSDGEMMTFAQQTGRLINWNVEQLICILKEILARRSHTHSQSPLLSVTNSSDDTVNTFPINEVEEIITLPEFDAVTNHRNVDAADIVVSPLVVEQLKGYVSWVASMYKNNPFHNFDHASHVVMSVIKLMSRIVAPADQDISDNAATLHDHTYGITSDPLTQFACVFSALIHDVDHTGVPNTTLVAEHTDIAAKYNNRSVAEQNSLDLAWRELMNKTKYSELHSTLFANQDELTRFRKLVVNGVMATDIADKDLKTLRNNRWDKAFKVDPNHEISSKQEQKDAVNRKATIVIEHLIQASDVSHTMQHWHVFRKWNQSLFEEMYEAYRTGRAEQNPADFWYQGEIGFFDFYIIPLAKKLKDCGVFGVSSDEYLNYAMKNREEWEARGHEVVMEMVEAVAENERKRMESVSMSNEEKSELHGLYDI